MVADQHEVTAEMKQIANWAVNRVTFRLLYFPPDLLHDINQAALVAVWRAAPKWMPDRGTKLSTWMFIVALRAARLELDRQMQYLKHAQQFDGAVHDICGREDEHHSKDVDGDKATVARVLRALTPKQRDAIEAVYLRGETRRGYGRKNRLSHGAAHALIKTAMNNIRGTLQLPQAAATGPAV